MDYYYCGPLLWRSLCLISAKMTTIKELVAHAKKEQERLSGKATKSYYVTERIPSSPKDWKVLKMGKRLSADKLRFAKENSHKVEPLGIPNAK